MEIVGLRELRGEGAGPECLEVDRVRENDDRLRVDILRLEQVLDFSLGLLFDPVIDILPRGRGRLPEVNREQPALVVTFNQLLEFGEDALPDCVQSALAVRSSTAAAALGPCRGIVSVVQIGEKSMKRGVELPRRQVEMHGLGDLRGRFAAGARVGHGESA